VHPVDGDEFLRQRIGDAKVIGLRADNAADDLALAEPADEAVQPLTL
jgi:hypothetical protein